MSRKDCGEAGCAEGCCGTAGCLSSARRSEPAPIDMVLHCPACGLQHIDASEAFGEGGECVDGGWANPPHRTHLCHGCGHKWRPADVPTNGVAAVKTRGKNDSPIVAQAAPAPQADHTALLKMLAQRARSFPNFPMGYHMPEVFAALGEAPPEPTAQAAPAPQASGRPVADASIKALYVAQHGSDAGWLGIEGSYFISGVQAAQGRVQELERVLGAVQQEFHRVVREGNNFPDGFNGRLYRWVDDAMAGSAQAAPAPQAEAMEGYRMVKLKPAGYRTRRGAVYGATTVVTRDGATPLYEVTEESEPAAAAPVQPLTVLAHRLADELRDRMCSDCKPSDTGASCCMPGARAALEDARAHGITATPAKG